MKHFGKMAAILLTTVVVVGAVVAALELTNTTHLFHASSTKSTSSIDYGPPSKSAVEDSESRKSDAPSSSKTDENNNQGSTGSGDKKNTSVEISTWVQTQTSLNVNGFAADVVEDGGTLYSKLVAKSDGTKVTQSRPAVSNASNTSCGVTEVPLSKLHTGTWTATLEYSSTAYGGTSDPLEVEVK